MLQRNKSYVDLFDDYIACRKMISVNLPHFMSLMQAPFHSMYSFPCEKAHFYTVCACLVENHSLRWGYVVS